MKRLVPVLMMVLCSYFISQKSWADVAEVMKKCGGGSFCGATVEMGAREGLCLLSGKAFGCSAPPAMPKYETLINSTITLDGAEQDCEKRKKAAERCCSLGEGCNDGLGRVGDMAGGGLKAGAAKDAKNNELARNEYRRIRGRCLAFAAACSKVCDGVAAKIKEARSLGGGCPPAGCAAGSWPPDLTTPIREAQAKSQMCQAMKGSAAELAEKEYEKGKEGAEETETAAGGDPGGGTSPGGGKGPGGGGSGFDPSSLMSALQGLVNKPKEEPEPFQSQTCEENPNLAGCDPCKSNPSLPQCLAKENWENLGKSKTAEGDQDVSENDFNVGDPGPVGPQSMDPLERQPAPPVTVSPVANGGGGFAGGGGGSGAQLGAQGGGGGGGGSRTNTDIMRGERSGGGGGMSALNAGMQLQSGNGGGFAGYGGRGDGPRMDLSQFLPGGTKDPTRRIAGQSAEGVQINSREVNIWNRISERFRARCVAGRLRDCVP